MHNRIRRKNAAHLKEQRSGKEILFIMKVSKMLGYTRRMFVKSVWQKSPIFENDSFSNEISITVYVKILFRRILL